MIDNPHNPPLFDTNWNDICANLHKNEPHSVKANPSRQDKGQQLLRVLRAFLRVPQAICEDVEKRLDMSHQSCSARFSDLKRLGLIEKCGTGKTTSGRSAGMYRLTELGEWYFGK